MKINFITTTKKLFSSLKTNNISSISGSSILKWFLLSLTCLLILVYAVWQNIPAEKIKNKALEIASGQLADGYSIEIDSLTKTFSGFELENIALTKNDENILRINNVKVSLLSWRLIYLSIPITADLYDGSIMSVYSLWTGGISVNNGNFNLNFVPLVRSANFFSGPVPISFTANFINNSANLTFELLGLSIKLKDNEYTSVLPFNIPDAIELGDARGQFVFNEAEKKLSLQLAGDITGSFDITSNWTGDPLSSSYDLIVRVRLTEQLLQTDVVSLFLQQYLNGDSVELNAKFNGYFDEYSIDKLSAQ